VEAVTAGRRVVIAEDSVLLLAGLTKLLESAGFEVAATAADAEGLLAAVEREQPDVVIADVRMPPTHTDEGIRAALVIRSQWPEVAVLVLSQYVEERYAADLLSANTRGIGYLLKDRVADVAEFLDALRRVAAGGTALDPEVVAQLLVRRGGDPLDNLTERERGVLALMAEGRSNAEIAAALVITDSAVSKHINSIFAKLGLYPRDAGHRRVLAVLHYLGVEPALSRAAAASAAPRRSDTRGHEVYHGCPAMLCAGRGSQTKEDRNAGQPDADQEPVGPVPIRQRETRTGIPAALPGPPDRCEQPGRHLGVRDRAGDLPGHQPPALSPDRVRGSCRRIRDRRGDRKLPQQAAGGHQGGPGRRRGDRYPVRSDHWRPHRETAGDARLVGHPDPGRDDGGRNRVRVPRDDGKVAGPPVGRPDRTGLRGLSRG
jgi:DNA-binding NarL/FixJ family response regulator